MTADGFSVVTVSLDRALKEQLLLTEEAKVTPSAGGSPYFTAQPVRFAVAYPNYCVDVSNACNKAESGTVHVYLAN